MRVRNHRPQQEEPSHRVQAEQILGKLAEQLQVLKFLEYELRHRTDQTLDERTRARAIVAALEYLQQAMDALELASRE